MVFLGQKHFPSGRPDQQNYLPKLTYPKTLQKSSSFFKPKISKSPYKSFLAKKLQMERQSGRKNILKQHWMDARPMLQLFKRSRPFHGMTFYQISGKIRLRAQNSYSQVLVIVPI